MDVGLNRGKERVYGHLNGVESIRATVTTAVKLGIKHLTFYAFSTENWSRPKEEVNALMDLLVTTIVNETEELFEQGVALNTIGDLSALPQKCQTLLKEAREASPLDCKLELTLALNYSSKWEITCALKSIIDDGLKSNEVEPETISKYLATAGKPDPELIHALNRISNFMLWQLAYSEFHFSNVLWPDFREKHFIEAVRLSKRDRRFGGVSKSEDEWGFI